MPTIAPATSCFGTIDVKGVRGIAGAMVPLV